MHSSPSLAPFCALAALLLALAGCGTSPQPDFSITLLPATVVLANSGPAQALTLGATALNSFTGPITVTISGLPPGVTATPISLTLTPGSLQQIMLRSVGAALTTTPAVNILATSGALTRTTSASVQVTAATTSASLSATSFHFGDNLVGNTMTKTIVTVTNTGSAPLILLPTVTGDSAFSLSSATSANLCVSPLKAGASCILKVSFSPTSNAPAVPAATLNLGFGNVSPDTPQTVALSGTSAALSPGTVVATANPQVAQYSLNLPYPGAFTVAFGPDTKYGKYTWSQSSTIAGPVTILVAGMLPNATYHMQASVTFANGITATDVDHTFTTQDSLIHPILTTTTTAGLTPQPGVELLTFVGAPATGLAVSDLSGNILWTYAPANPGVGNQVQGARLLPNGHFLITLGQGSNLALSTTVFPQGAIDSLREIDLAGNIVRQITTTDLTAELASAGYNLLLQEFHHDITPLPNGHWIVLANVLKPFRDLAGYPGTTNVLGDVIIDLDQNLQPVWVWNSFDHLDVNRHPEYFPDWTHSNAIVYSPSDGNLILSIRHQNWVVKLDYNNGKGSGNILWHLGAGGDFALVNGTDPTDWPSAQHYPVLFSPNSAGTFSLGMMDNGDFRPFPDGVQCDTTGAPPCSYTTIPVFQIDETHRTATLTSHNILPPSLYSSWGGSVDLLANGNTEFDLTGESSGQSILFEVTPGSAPRTVWQMTTNSPAYRGIRLPSLYPGVQW